VGPGQDGVRRMGARDVGEDGNAIERTIVQDGQEEDEGVLQQHQREKRTGKHHPLPRPIHDMVQPPEKASEHRSNPYGGGLILTVSHRLLLIRVLFLSTVHTPLSLIGTSFVMGSKSDEEERSRKSHVVIHE